MAKFTQSGKALAITTPLGPDVLLLEKLVATEGLSQLFYVRLSLLTERTTPLPFESLLGAKAAALIRPHDGTNPRYFHGIIKSLTKGPHVRGRQQVTFTRYEAELVPEMWLLTKKVQSRIFQSLAVPDILLQVLKKDWGLNVVSRLVGTFAPRDYCVQYRESDFDFVSRLMEDEGIYYFFIHSASGHQLVLANTPQGHPSIPVVDPVLFDEETSQLPKQDRLTQWQVKQEIRSGKVTLRDHCFELPHQRLEAQDNVQSKTVRAGQVSFSLGAGSNQRLEIYDFPGSYARRFDGVDPAGSDRPKDLERIHEDKTRTAAIRMQEEAAGALTITGVSHCRHFVSGHKFNLDRHPDANGSYVLTEVVHSASVEGAYTTGDGDTPLIYQNDFTCLPLALPYRPPRRTSKPTFEGVQTAIVVGPPGEQIHCDKYGRVKVQFHWDRRDGFNADSSCWIRVMQPWAGGGFGALALPRVGHEVVVAFDEGDPDQPIILGGVYNAREMPPFTLPAHRMISGIKANSVGGHPSKDFSGVSFNDTPSSERVALYSQKDMLVNSENNLNHHVGKYQHAQVGRMSLSTVGGIPTGGGSGGGGGPPHSTDTGVTSTTTRQDGGTATSVQKDDPGYANWKSSNGLLTAQPGLAGTCVLGVNLQDTVGFLHQVTVGFAYQVCIGVPGSAWGFVQGADVSNPSAAWGFGGAFGGNVQLTWGTNTQAVYGTSISVTHGAVIQIAGKYGDTPGTEVGPLTLTCAIAVPVLTALYEFTYLGIGSQDDVDTKRDALVIAGTAVLAAGTGLLLTGEMIDKADFYRRDMQNTATETSGIVTSLTMALGIQADALPKAALLTVEVKGDAIQTAIHSEKAKLSSADKPGRISYIGGPIIEVGNNIQIVSRSDATDPAPLNIIYVNAVGNGKNGVLLLNATQGIAIGSGSAVQGLVNQGQDNGFVSLTCGMKGTIIISNLQEVPGPAKPQMVKLEPGNLTIDGGMLPKPGKITLQVMGGPPKGSSIVLDPDPAKGGITLTAGQNTIVMDQKSVTIDGISVKTQALTLEETVKVMRKMKTQLESVESSLTQMKRQMKMEQ
jgi:type VI secretion system secreted protein VgrG